MAPSVKSRIASCLANALTELDLDNSGIDHIHETLFDCEMLERLSLSGNKLTEIPQTVSGLRSLQALTLFGNHIKRLPMTIVELKQLSYLILACNALRELPPGFGALAKLTLLDLSNNKLKSIEPNFGYLAELRVLHLSDNRLEYLPGELGLLSKLEVLSVRDNKLRCLPASIGQLQNLRLLCAQGNQIAWLPMELANCKSLMQTTETMLMFGNPLTSQVVQVLVEEGPLGLIPVLREPEYVDKINAIRRNLPPSQRGTHDGKLEVMQDPVHAVEQLRKSYAEEDSTDEEEEEPRLQLDTIEEKEGNIIKNVTNTQSETSGGSDARRSSQHSQDSQVTYWMEKDTRSVMGTEGSMGPMSPNISGSNPFSMSTDPRYSRMSNMTSSHMTNSMMGPRSPGFSEQILRDPLAIDNDAVRLSSIRASAFHGASTRTSNTLGSSVTGTINRK